MAWSCFVALLLLVASPLRLGQHLHPKPGLGYSYDCGVQGMQLLVFPRTNQTVRFKVLDEFGNRFEVNNCSICYHWVISEPQEPAVFSADYRGCHVLEKDGRFHLRVFIQAVLPNGHVDTAQDITLICPKPDILTPDPYLALPATPEPATPEPATPEPATPEPATPEPATPEPATPEPATPEPATPEPATPEPATPEPATPEPATPEPATPEPATPEPATPEPATPEPATPQPATPQPATPQPATPQPATPQPATPQPATPQPATPQPTTPHTLALHPISGHTLAGSGHTLSTLYPEHSFVHSTPAPPSLASGPTGPTTPHPQWGTLGPDSVGTHLPQEQCQVASGHIPCMVKSSSKEACQQAGCCYDNTREVPCYYGNTATLQCFRSGYFILVMSQETALTHKVMLDNVYLTYAPNGCPPAQKTSAFVVFRVPLTLCGTTIQMVGEQLIYENQLVSNIDVQKGPQGSITRDSVFRLHVRCIFNASDFLPIQASIYSPQPPAPVIQSGPLRLELRIAKDETFSSYYQASDYPLVRLLQEPVHVEVRLLQRTDPSLVLVLHQCWATPTASPFQQPQWPILLDGCPFKGDNYRTQLMAANRAELPFWSHHQRFTIATFTLLDSSSQNALRGQVYFFCSASACHPAGRETCSTTCDSGMARRRRSSGHNSTLWALDIVSSPGAVGFEDAAKLKPSGFNPSSSSSPLLWVLLLLLAITLVLGAGVFVGLSWAWAQKLQEGTRC